MLQNELGSLFKQWEFQNETNVFIDDSDQTERQRWSNRTGSSIRSWKIEVEGDGTLAELFPADDTVFSIHVGWS